MKISKIICLVFIGFSFTGQAQLTFKLLKTIPVKKGADLLTADQFGNLFLSYQEELIKLSPQGKELYSYSDPLYGDISTVDALNAMNPLVFYNDVNQLRLLDNRLNESRAYNLLDAGFIDPALVAYTDEDNIWIYDQVQDRLIRYNLRFSKPNAQSLTITQITEYENKPEGLFCSFNNVLLALPGQGLLVFDALGAYEKTVTLPKNQMLSFYNQSLLMVSPQGGVTLYNLEKDKKWLGLLPEKGIEKVYFEGSKIYLLINNSLKVYEVIR
jgi:hypothetical protein